MDLFTNIDVDLKRLLEVVTARQQQDTDVWLDAIKDDDLYEELVTIRLDGTCNWILDHPAYTTLVSESLDDGVAKLLWINGPAGFGKSVLSASLIRHLGTTPEIPLAYCFSFSHAQSLHGLHGTVRTWITQLIRKDKAILDIVHQMRQKQNTRTASRDDIWALLKDIAAQIQSCTLVLDGLDEFESVDDARRRFLRNLKKAIQGTRTRVLITSRNEFDIESELRSSATGLETYIVLDCRISRDDVKDDIDLVSQSIVARKLPKQGHSLRQELATKMAERCDGQFLWLKLQQGLLRDSKSAKALRGIVEAMPQRLHSIYGRSWKDVQALEEPDRSRAVDTLRWLTFAYRPLAIQELAEALIISLNSDMVAFSVDDLPRNIDDEYIDGEIKNLCGSLIELRDDSSCPGPEFRTIHLVHASVHEFLLEKLPVPPFVGPLPGITRLSSAQHATLAAHCIRFLDCPEAWESSEGDCRSFANYATYSWFRHLRDSESCYDTVSDLVENFMRPGNDNFKKWQELYEREDFVTAWKSATSFYYACLFGLVPAMDYLYINEDIDINSVGGKYGTPLQATCTQGHIDAFQRLALWKANITVHGGRFNNALNAAAWHGRLSMVKTLLCIGGTTYSMDPEKHEAMTIAAGQGHVDVVQLLLSQGAEASPLDLFYSFQRQFGERSAIVTPLHAAAINDHFDTVELLLDHGADPNIPNDDGETALHLAVVGNLHGIVELLFQHSANANIHGRWGPPLLLAAANGYLNIVIQLIDQKAVLDVGDCDKSTPLHHAAQFGHAAVVGLLLEKGATANAQNASGRTPLHTAAGNGQLTTIEVLIDEGAAVNIRDEAGSTALYDSILNDHFEVAEFLLQKGATPRTAVDGWTPLHFAVSKGAFDLVMSLIQHGADKNAQTHAGWTPLHCAIGGNHLGLAESLLEQGAAIKANKTGWTPLHLAARRAQHNVTIQLLERGADINARTEHGLTPLAFSNSPNEEVNDQQRLEEVRLLFRQGAAFNSDSRCWSPLHIAAREDHCQIIAYYLDQGIDINAQTNCGRTALWIAIDNGSLGTAELLIGRGAEVDISDRDGEVALHVAVEHEDLRFAQSLIERNCNVNVLSKEGISSLRRAIEWGTDEVVEYLIRSGAKLDAMDCYGMRCSDWLQRLRPNISLPRAVDGEFDGISASPDMAVLRRTLRDVATRIKGVEATREGEYYILAHCFLLLDREEDARLAYQQRLLSHDSPGSASICDGCKVRQNLVDPFFACKTCPDRDLCESCMEKHGSESVLDICRNHDFLRIVVAEAKFQPSDTEAFSQWLDGIVEEFKDA